MFFSKNLIFSVSPPGNFARESGSLVGGFSRAGGGITAGGEVTVG